MFYDQFIIKRIVFLNLSKNTKNKAIFKYFEIKI